MIDLKRTWIPQMIWYCELVGDPARLHSAFHQQEDAIWTSVTSYDELIEQIFDDLASCEMLERLNLEESVPHRLRERLVAFITALNDLDKSLPQGEDPDFDAQAWRGIEASAQHVVSEVNAAVASGYKLQPEPSLEA